MENLTELVAAKNKLDKEVRSLLVEFREKTGYVIQAINIVTIDAASRCGPDFITGTVDCQIKL